MPEPISAEDRHRWPNLPRTFTQAVEQPKPWFEPVLAFTAPSPGRKLPGYEWVYLSAMADLALHCAEVMQHVDDALWRERLRLRVAYDRALSWAAILNCPDCYPLTRDYIERHPLS